MVIDCNMNITNGKVNKLVRKQSADINNSRMVFHFSTYCCFSRSIANSRTSFDNSCFVSIVNCSTYLLLIKFLFFNLV